MSRTYLVTGGGFIAAQLLIAKLIEKGNLVYALFTSPKQVPMSLLGKINLKFAFIDFERETGFEKSLPTMADGIFHLYDVEVGHQANSKMFMGNSLSTLLLLDWGKKAGIKEFVLGSSSIVYGGGEAQLSESDRPRPTTFSALTKYIAEMVAGFYQKFFNIKILRIFPVFGPGVNSGLFYEIMTRIKDDETIDLPCSKVTPIYLNDLVEVLIKVLELDGSMILNVCGSEVVTMNEAVSMIGDLLGKRPKLTGSPKSSYVGSNKKLTDLTGFSFNLPFRSGVEQMAKGLK